MKQFAAWLVLGEKGFDAEATVAAFRTELEAALKTSAEELTRVAAQVEKVLTENRGKNTNMDFVTGTVVRNLGIDADNHSRVKSLAADYIRSNACGEKDGKPLDLKSGEPIAAAKRYFVGKGPGAGVCYFTDRVQKQAAKAQAAAAK